MTSLWDEVLGLGFTWSSLKQIVPEDQHKPRLTERLKIYPESQGRGQQRNSMRAVTKSWD